MCLSKLVKVWKLYPDLTIRANNDGIKTHISSMNDGIKKPTLFIRAGVTG